MALFNFFKRKGSDKEMDDRQLPEIPEQVFIEQDYAEYKGVSGQISEGIHTIYHFLQSDFESKGYEDALISPDESYKNDNLQLILFDLNIIVHKVNVYHQSLMKEIDFHISSRKRAGLIDLVEELQTKKNDLQDHIQKVKEIESSLENGTGLYKRALLAYSRGFTKGLTSITQSSLFTKRF